MIRWLQYLFIVLLFLWSPNLYAQKAVDKEISLIYHNLGDKNEFTENDFNFLQSLKGSDLLQSPDSIIYQYHYLIGSWLDYNDGDLQKRTYHIEKALHLIESKPIFSLGIFDIEYLWLSNAMAGCYEKLGNIDKAIFQYERTLVRGEKFLNKESSNNIRGAKSNCILSLGELYAKKGYRREAISCFEKAFEISSVDYEPGVIETYFPLWRLCVYYEDLKDYDKSVSSWKRLLQFFEEHHAILTEEYAKTYYFLGATYSAAKDLNSSIASYKRAISIYQQINASLEEVKSTYDNLLCAYAKAGNIDGFKEIKSILQEYYFSQNKKEDYYRSLWAASTLLPSDEVKQVMDELLENFSKLEISQQVKIMMRLADINLDIEPQNSILYCDRAINIINQSEDRNIAVGWLYTLYQIRSLAYQKQSDFKSAINDALCALDHFSKCNDATDKTKQQLLFRTISLYLEDKDYKKIVGLEKELLPLTKKIYSEKSHEYVSNLTLNGISLMYNRKYKKAINTFKGLSSLILQIDGERSINFATNLHNMGRAYMLKGDNKKAIAYLEKAKALQLSIEGTIDDKTNQYLNELGIYE